MNSRGIFVTGTDTGIGKTLVTAALLALLRESGVDAVPMKPVQSGCELKDGKLTAPDLDFALAAAGMDAGDEAALMCPYKFEDACSPHLAAERAGEVIDIDRILSAFEQLASAHESVIVEGAGGLMVPLTREVMMIDLATKLALPLLLVARPRLGTLNHTLLSLKALAQAGLTTLGVVINDATDEDWTYIEEDNRKTIASLGNVPVLAGLPHLSDPDDPAGILPACREALAPVVAAVRG